MSSSRPLPECCSGFSPFSPRIPPRLCRSCSWPSSPPSARRSEICPSSRAMESLLSWCRDWGVNPGDERINAGRRALDRYQEQCPRALLGEWWATVTHITRPGLAHLWASEMKSTGPLLQKLLTATLYLCEGQMRYSSCEWTARIVQVPGMMCVSKRVLLLLLSGPWQSLPALRSSLNPEELTRPRELSKF